MAHPYHHALASVNKWGGEVPDYLPLHDWFDLMWTGKSFFSRCSAPLSEASPMPRTYTRPRFMAATVHIMLETVYGPTITLSTGRVIPTHWVGEQHVQQDLGFIPSFADWMRAIRPLPWMGRSGRVEDHQPIPEPG